LSSGLEQATYTCSVPV